MRPYAELEADARDGSPFSNSTEGECWTANWCDRCIHDRPAREGRYEDACPLLLISLCGKTPVEWLEQDSSDGYRLGDQYHCIEFRDEDDGPSEPPEPPPQCPGQGELFDPAPYESVRMFADVVSRNQPVEVAP